MKMSKFALTLLFSSLFITVNSHAENPVHGKDQRIQYFTFDAGNVYQIYSKLGYSTLIQLEDGEHLQDDGVLGMGYAKGWSVGVKGNNIVFKPIGDSPDTNMVIVTNKRTYAFDLKVRDNGITYVAKFKYPDTEQKYKEKVANKLPQQLYIRPIKDKDDKEIYIDNRINTSYFKKGNLEITPTNVWDDNLFTFLKYDNANDLPSVYKVMPDGSEVLINSHTKEDTLIVHEVVKTLRLRLGKSVADIHNGTFRQTPFNKNGTSEIDTFRIEK